MIKELAISSIEMGDGTQSRECIDLETVKSYALDIQAGASFPPITVFNCEGEYWLADGFHRVKALQKLSRETIEAEVLDGDRRDAVLFSVGANVANGLRRTNADKKHAIKTLLRDEEWSEWADREIAEKCGVSHPFVAKLRNLGDLSGNGFQIDRPATRTVQRGGTTFKQNTKNIGRKKPAVNATGESVLSDNRALIGDAGFYVSESLRCLRTIEKTDPDRARALRKVRAWIDAELELCVPPKTELNDRIPLAIPAHESDQSNPTAIANRVK